MASSNIKNPPALAKSSTFDSWEKSINLWVLITELPKAKQGAALVLSLEGKDRDTVLELPLTDINSDDGVKKIIDKLGTIYKKDQVDAAYETFEKFINFRRESSMNMNNFISEFESKYNKAKNHGFELSSSSLAFFLLNQAKLSDDHKKLIRATLDKFDYNDMKTKLKKVFSSGQQDSKEEDIKIKIEDVNLAEDDEEDVLYGRYYARNESRGYPRSNWRGNSWGYRGNFSGNRGNKTYQRPYGGNRGFNKDNRTFNAGSSEKSTRRTKCSYCESIFHQIYNCPDKVYFTTEQEDEETNYDVVLYQSNLLTEKEFQIFVSESATSAILDSGASATVAGKVWFESYLEGLSQEELQMVEYMDTNSSFKFGSDEKFPGLFKAKIPAKIGQKKIFITTDVIETTIPLLMSKDAMKSASTKIDFMTDSVSMFGEKQDVHVTQSGHYAIALNDSKNIMRDIQCNKNVKVSFIVQNIENMDKTKIAKKLHAHFGHARPQKLIKLLERAGVEDDDELIEKIHEVSDKCGVCQDFAKPSPRPTVGLPHASSFNETVAMDLKFFEGKIILHLIDHLTRFSSACIVKSKEPNEIISGICKIWITIFGPPQKFLTDNGGEFANEKFLDLAEKMNIRVMTTAAESPWSNGLVERHNAVLSEMLYKIIADERQNINTALAWALQAKNSLANVNGFSPMQLTMGQNPQLPSVLTNKPPANEEPASSDIMREQLNCMKAARKAFIEAESSDKIKRALVRNIRPGANNKFYTGDIVYYKRNDSRKWKGPGRVIGYESSNILIKHGSQYVRVHACRVMLDRNVYATEDQDKKKEDEEDQDKKKGDEEYQDKKKEDYEDETKNASTESNDESSSDECCMEFSGMENLNDKDLSHVTDDNEYVSADSQENEVPIDKTSKISKIKHKLKKDMKIDFEVRDGQARSGIVVGRTGKASGKYKHFWNIKDCDSGVVKEFDTENDFLSWNEKTSNNNSKVVENSDEVFLLQKDLKEKFGENIEEAKKNEIDKWVQQGVYMEVKDIGQDRISTTWVVTSKKDKDDKVVVKARLVARGYEELKEIRSDSPTCQKENIRMLLSLAVAKEWTVNSLDVKAAFLQGKAIERNIYLMPPKEFRKDHVLWKLNKVVYGLCDASRSWYLRVAEVLTRLGMQVSQYDKSVFRYGHEQIKGIILIHVDDILYFGSDKFLKSVVQPFKDTFQISRDESEVFKYVGIQIKQNTHNLEISQKQYLDTMKLDLLPSEATADKYRFATDAEKKIFRQGVGQLGWISSISRPEASFMYCHLSTLQSKPQVVDFLKYKKAVKDLKSSESIIKIEKINFSNLEMSIFCDASFANLAGGASQLGYIIFLHDKQGCSVPVAWSSKKCKRVARSTLTAETLAAVEAVDAAVLLKKMIEEVVMYEMPAITVYVDNKSLYDTTKTSNVLADKRLMVDMAALREMIDRKEIIIKWISTQLQLADVLTKSGVNKSKLTDVLSNGRLDFR